MIYAVMDKGTPDLERKACYDCHYNQAALSWWCVNKEAIARRGSQIPDEVNCSQWKPVKLKSELSFWEKLFGSYITIPHHILED